MDWKARRLESRSPLSVAFENPSSFDGSGYKKSFCREEE